MPKNKGKVSLAMTSRCLPLETPLSVQMLTHNREARIAAVERTRMIMKNVSLRSRRRAKVSTF